MTRGSEPRVLYVAFDAADARLLQDMAERGRCPNLARLMREGAVVDTVAPQGTYVGASWMTISTGTDPATHGYWNWLEVDAATYATRPTTPRDSRVTPFWQHLSDAGHSVVVFDVPHADVPDHLNGLLVKEWGCHDRHFGTASYPAELLTEIEDRVGSHYGSGPTPFGTEAFAPCDGLVRGDLAMTTLRTADEEFDLRRHLLSGAARKQSANRLLMGSVDWDLFMTVFGESHCVGHQLWHVHDRSHQRHDAGARSDLGDPVEDVYAHLDAHLGELLDSLDDDTVVWFQCNHGMGPHYDGAHLLDEVLWRLDRSMTGDLTPWPATRGAAEVLRRMPARARPGARRTIAAALRSKARWHPLVGDPVRGPSPDRRFYQIDGNTAVGAVRFNLSGREAGGLVEPGAELERLRSALEEALLEVVNVDTGRPAVERVVTADEFLARSPDDALPDLFVEWDRSAPIEHLWSPRIGSVSGPYEYWRTGDHVPGGLVVVRGEGVQPGRRSGVMALTDVAPTLCATLGSPLPHTDGIVRNDLIPAGTLQAAVERAVAAEVEITRLDAELTAHTKALASLEDRLARRIDRLERMEEVWATMAWLANTSVPESELVSVIIPTHRRPDKLRRALASILAQEYSNWEAIIIDDGTGTAAPIVAEFDDPRIRLLEVPHGGACAARNAGLEMVRGALVAYLDDDNEMEPMWLKAVVWAFGTRPDQDTLYGVRLFDDVDRTFARGSGGMPWLQFERFDGADLRHGNLADMNVIAHRAGHPGARFDERFIEAGDWDFLLSLTEHSVPIELPVFAVRYHTDGSDRLSGVSPDCLDAVRDKWARRTPPSTGMADVAP